MNIRQDPLPCPKCGETRIVCYSSYEVFESDDHPGKNRLRVVHNAKCFNCEYSVKLKPLLPINMCNDIKTPGEDNKKHRPTMIWNWYYLQNVKKLSIEEIQALFTL